MFDRQGLLSAGAGLLIVWAGLLAGCGSGSGDSEDMAGPFPVSAVVAKVERDLVEERVVVVGSLEAKNEVTILSELAAEVVEISFEEGQAVSKGDILFRLDDLRSRAQLEQAQA